MKQTSKHVLKQANETEIHKNESICMCVSERGWMYAAQIQIEKHNAKNKGNNKAAIVLDKKI